MMRSMLAAVAAGWCLQVAAQTTYTDTVTIALGELEPGHTFKVAWSRGPLGQEFGFLNRVTVWHSLCTYNNKTNKIDTVLTSTDINSDRFKANCTRPMITHDGSRIVFSNAKDSTVYITNFDRAVTPAVRRVAKGIAGALWYNPENGKEYAIYGKNGSIESPAPVWAANLDDSTDSKELISKQRMELAAPGTTPPGMLTAYWMGVNRPGTWLLVGSGWPSFSCLQISMTGPTPTPQDSKYAPTGCWGGMTYEDNFRQIVFVESHNAATVVSCNGAKNHNFIPICPWKGVPCADHNLNLLKLATYNPNYLACIDARMESSQGPGDVMIFKLNKCLTRSVWALKITNNAYASSPLDGFCDVWTTDTVTRWDSCTVADTACGVTEIDPFVGAESSPRRRGPAYFPGESMLEVYSRNEGSGEISFMSLDGRIARRLSGVEFVKGANRISLGAPGLRRGVYVIRIRAGEETSCGSVVVH